MTITKDKVVLIHYTLKDNTGETIDSSEGKEPLAYIQGIGNLIVGLEEELEGKAAGDKVKATVAPEKGYGLRHEENVHIVPLSGFQADGDEQLEVGMQVRVETNEGISMADVVKIEGDEVTLDLNHPLAGETLHFDVEIIDVRDATKQELEHGHAHGPGGHHHH
ncbi:MAG: peptidylprolyl isomerase [Flavobacteriales bacterium]|nr:peptidylprolyl isomerase [Flavobacteriales bacterium]